MFCVHESEKVYIEDVLSLFRDFPDSVIFALEAPENATSRDIEKLAISDYYSDTPVYAGTFDQDCDCAQNAI